MDELSVIGALGPPTSMREENGARVLLYAMEIGSSGFLGGSVSLRDRKVVEIQKPALKCSWLCARLHPLRRVQPLHPRRHAG